MIWKTIMTSVSWYGKTGLLSVRQKTIHETLRFVGPQFPDPYLLSFIHPKDKQHLYSHNRGSTTNSWKKKKKPIPLFKLYLTPLSTESLMVQECIVVGILLRRLWKGRWKSTRRSVDYATYTVRTFLILRHPTVVFYLSSTKSISLSSPYPGRRL